MNKKKEEEEYLLKDQLNLTPTDMLHLKSTKLSEPINQLTNKVSVALSEDEHDRLIPLDCFLKIYIIFPNPHRHHPLPIDIPHRLLLDWQRGSEGNPKIYISINNSINSEINLKSNNNTMN